MNLAVVFEEGKLGGPQIYMLTLFNGYRSDTLSPSFIFPFENSSEFQARCVSAGIDYQRLSLSRLTRDFSVAVRYVLLFFVEVYRLSSAFRRQSVDLVYVAGGSWQFKGVLAALVARKKIIWHLNDSKMPWFIRFIYSVLNRAVNGIIYASERSEAYYGPLSRQSIPSCVIPSPIDIDFFASKSKQSVSLESTRQSRPFRVVTVANISPVKDVETLLRTAQILSDLKSDLEFVVIGPVFASQRNYFEKIKALSGSLDVENVKFLGRRSDVRPFLDSADVYLCTSVAESSPIAVWEALAMSLPVVSTDVGDVFKYLSRGNCGLVAEIGDAAGLAAHIRSLYECPELGQEMGARGVQVVKNSLSADRCLSAHLDFFQRIVS